MSRKITIGITDCSKYDNYKTWIEEEEGTVAIRLSPALNNLDDLGKCDGILLTGGEDVHPRFYNKKEYVDLCEEIDEKRDEFEWKVLEYTANNHVALLGICRGLQMANVYFGGTLIPHIPAFGKFDHSKTGSSDKYHQVQVDPDSFLGSIVGSSGGEVNSAHHQSADLVGKGLVCNAISPDGIVEGLERENAEDGPFLLLVQWHPERMKDQASRFSRSLKRTFLEAVKKSR